MAAAETQVLEAPTLNPAHPVNTRPPESPEERRAYLVDLALQAFQAVATDRDALLTDGIAAALRARLEERMAQAAQAWTFDVDALADAEVALEAARADIEMHRSFTRSSESTLHHDLTRAQALAALSLDALEMQGRVLRELRHGFTERPRPPETTTTGDENG